MFKRSFLFFSFVVLFFTYGVAQEGLRWKDFTDVKLKRKYFEKYDVDFLMPTFGTHIKSYAGKQISIKGYFLNLASDGSLFMISKKPMATCFFCGGAGAETVIEVNFKTKPSFRTDQIVEITGNLKLNPQDVEHCMYILNNASGKLVN